MAVPNQKIVRTRNKSTSSPFAQYSKSEMRNAAANLTSSGFYLWLEFCGNQQDYEMEASCKFFCDYWGMGKSSYHRAFAELIEKNYLVEEASGSNIYNFYSTPVRPKTSLRETISTLIDQQEEF